MSLSRGTRRDAEVVRTKQRRKTLQEGDREVYQVRTRSKFNTESTREDSPVGTGESSFIEGASVQEKTLG